ncbi:MAG: hypothetical protein WA718_17750 [Terriglobales bacterium]
MRQKKKKEVVIAEKSAEGRAREITEENTDRLANFITLPLYFLQS